MKGKITIQLNDEGNINSLIEFSPLNAMEMSFFVVELEKLKLQIINRITDTSTLLDYEVDGKLK